MADYSVQSRVPSVDYGVLAVGDTVADLGLTGGQGGVGNWPPKDRIVPGTQAFPSFTMVAEGLDNSTFKCMYPQVVAVEWTDPGNWKGVKMSGGKVGVTGYREVPVAEASFSMGEDVWLVATKGDDGTWQSAELASSPGDEDFCLHVARISGTGIEQFHVGAVVLPEPPSDESSQESSQESSPGRPSSGEESPSPGEESSSPGEESSSPGEESPSPGEESPSPGEESPGAATVITDIKGFEIVCEDGKFKLKWKVVRRKVDGDVEFGSSEESSQETSLGEGESVVTNVRYENHAFKQAKRRAFVCGEESEGEVVGTATFPSEVCGG